MIRPDKELGVLNGWDLCRVHSKNVRGAERTGTLPFMAIDLLEEEYWDGEVVHLYRHDLEGFIWILPWFVDSKLEVPKFNNWQMGYETCREQKNDFISRFTKYNDVVTVWKAEWRLARRLLFWLRRRRNARECADDLDQLVEEEPSETYEDFCNALDYARKNYKPLRQLLHEVPMTIPASS